MPAPSTRADENGHITINPEACCGCGICVSGCPDRSLLFEGGNTPPDDALAALSGDKADDEGL